MVSWNSFPLEVIYQVLGWLAFLSWSVAGYPQLILNFRRKSVVGLSLDYEILNFTKQWSYLIYNASLFFSPAIQKQYFEKYGYGQMIPVAANDVAFSIHSVILNLIILSQISMFERGNQKFSNYAIAIVVVVWFSVAVCFFIALHSQSWLWLISIFNTIQAVMILIKYFPQVRMLYPPPYYVLHVACLVRCPRHAFSRLLAFMNFLRKSTDGFSIGSVLLDFSGGVFNYSQMLVQSKDQGL
ncbi:hypothetical protein JHK87_052541 [Glycine soja]|nr:hypothetical protein JHK87_052541 [Glycine soja]